MAIQKKTIAHFGALLLATSNVSAASPNLESYEAQIIAQLVRYQENCSSSFMDIFNQNNLDNYRRRQSCSETFLITDIARELNKKYDTESLADSTYRSLNDKQRSTLSEFTKLKFTSSLEDILGDDTYKYETTSTRNRKDSSDDGETTLTLKGYTSISD